MKPQQRTLYASVEIGRTGLFFKEGGVPAHGKCVASIDLNPLRNQGCRLSLFKPDGSKIEDEAVVNILRKHNGVIELSPGDCLTVTRGRFNMRIFNTLNENGLASLTFDNMKVDYINEKQLGRMRAAYLAYSNSPPVTQPEKGCRGGYHNNKSPVWKRALSSLAAGARSVLEEWRNTGKDNSADIY